MRKTGKQEGKTSFASCIPAFLILLIRKLRSAFFTGGLKPPAEVISHFCSGMNEENRKAGRENFFCFLHSCFPNSTYPETSFGVLYRRPKAACRSHFPLLLGNE